MFSLTNRRLIVICLVTLAILTCWRHILVLSRILPVYALWASFSAPNALALSRDAFDDSFARYPVRQWSAQWPPSTVDWESDETESSIFEGEERLMRLMDGTLAPTVGSEEYAAEPYSSDDEDVVPPVLHHILLGMERTRMPASWEASRQSCLQCVFFRAFFVLLLCAGVGWNANACGRAGCTPSPRIIPTCFGTTSQR